MKNFRKTLNDKKIVIFDGAIGTQLYERGIFFNLSFDGQNLTNPELVAQIHKDYIKAGAMAIETNTFGANRYKLKNFNLEDKVYEINKKGAEIASNAAGDKIFVAGSIGPLGIRIEPWGPTSLEEAKESFKEQALGLIDGGIDVFICETFGDITELGQAINGIKEVMKLKGVEIPIIAQMTVMEDGHSIYGTEPEIFTKRIEDWGADVIGLNCSIGPKAMLDVLEKMVKITTKPLSVMPNAGKPAHVEGRTLYLSNPEYFAFYVRRYIQVGAQIIGGCCGTTPEHIKKVSETIKMLLAEQKSIAVVESMDKVDTETTKKVQYQPILKQNKSRLAAKITEGKFVASCELTPPRGWDLSKIIEAAQKLKENNFDTINIPDGPRASAKLSPLAMAITIERNVGIETILHYTCRDRNLLGMQSDLLGAYSVGLRNLLIITGDPPVIGDYPNVTGVFDVDAIGLTNMVNYLNQGIDIGGKTIGKPTGFFIGVGANPTAVNIEKELKRFYWKVDAGAEYCITQPVFEPEQLENFLDKIKDYKIPVLAGIWPLQSLRNAEFLQNEVPGVILPQWIIEEMKKCNGDGEKERLTGLEIAKKILKQVYPFVNGVQIAAPFNRYDIAIELFNYARNIN